MSEYPKWKYRGSAASGAVVDNAEGEAALGDGWTDAPTEDAPQAEPAAVAQDDGSAAVVAALEASNAEQAARIAELEAAHAAQAEQIAKLTAAAEAKGKK